jgi:hypothetical protein
MLMFLLGLFIFSGCLTALAVFQYYKFKEPDRVIGALAIITVIFMFSICLCGAIEHHNSFENSMYKSCR